MSREELRRAAIALLEQNWTGSGTLPSPTQYPHQWSWDSAFIAIGWSHVNPGRARTELTSLFEGQWADGRLPHIKFDPSVSTEAYFPGPDFWGSATHPDAPAVATSGLVQPPIHARAAWSIHEADPSPETADFLAELYPRLVAWHRYLSGRRDLGGDGLVAILHPWESGLDNSPLWDEPLHRMRIDGPVEVRRRDTVNVEAAQRPSDRDYERYVALVDHYRGVAYDDARLGDHQFVVEDPVFNALLLDAELCLARIATALGQDDEPHRESARMLSAAMNRVLWDGERGWFAARDLVGQTLLGELTVSSLIPLLDPWLPAERRERTLALARSERFAGCPYPLPSVAVDAPSFDQRRYWRGPMWVNTNWLVSLGASAAGAEDLTGQVVDATLDAVSRAGFREYYDPVTGEGLGATQFSWTAALTVDWLSPRAASLPSRA